MKGMPVGWSLIANSSAASSDGNNVTTAGVTTTGADLIVIATSVLLSFTPTDNKGNTYTQLITVGGINMLRLWYKQTPAVGTGHTFSLTTSGRLPSIAALAFSGSTTSPADQTSSASATQPGSITPTVNNALVVTAAGDEDTVAETVDAPFSSNLKAAITGTSNNCGLGLAYEIQTTPTPRNPTWSSSPSRLSLIASFKPVPIPIAVLSAMLLKQQRG